MTVFDPSAVDSLLEWLRNVRESELQGPGQLGGRQVPKLADRAVLVGRVLLVADGRGSHGAGQRYRQEDDPGARAGATCCEPRVHGSSLGHQLSTLAEIPRGCKGRRDRTVVLDVRRRETSAAQTNRRASTAAAPDAPDERA